MKPARCSFLFILIFLGTLRRAEATDADRSHLTFVGNKGSDKQIEELYLKHGVPILVVKNRIYIPDAFCAHREIGGDSQSRLIGGEADQRLLGGAADARSFGGAADTRLMGGAADTRTMGGASDAREIDGDAESRDMGGGSDSRLFGGQAEGHSIGGDSSQRIFGGESNALNCMPGKKENGFYLTGMGNDSVIYFNGSRRDESINGFVPFPSSASDITKATDTGIVTKQAEATASPPEQQPPKTQAQPAVEKPVAGSKPRQNAAPSNTTLPSETMIVTVSKAKLRKSPSTKAAVIKTLKKGEEVTVVKRKNDWLMVELAGGEVGWCHKSSF
jgi:Bacterial SH3 domain